MRALTEAGRKIISFASGEIGLPALPVLADELALSTRESAYGPVGGNPDMLQAAAGYWTRRGLATGPNQLIAGPGTKPLIYAAISAMQGEVVVPQPSWVSYAVQAELAGKRVHRVPTRSTQGGIPDPALLADRIRSARSAGADPRIVVVTIPDNPTGDVASSDTLQDLASVARELDLVIISDEIYTDLVFEGTAPHPASFAPERTITTTGLTKSLALGGWRLGVLRTPATEFGARVHGAIKAVASQVWSSVAAPIQQAAVLAFNEPAEVRSWVSAARRLHQGVTGTLAAALSNIGADLPHPVATCYLYPSFDRLADKLAQHKQIHTSDELAKALLQHGIYCLPGNAFGDPPDRLTLRFSVSHLYGETAQEQEESLKSHDPTTLPWVQEPIRRLEAALKTLMSTD
ncbi:pyridoxal phosphate-dependent aminotransferase [Brevibacterium sp. XM4083]|uniref:pyridoxal phosphate-dependent aminotransferase n=1 Tax=Brevibacterium sp. XM4083 TaxID=2583238 RepID=UPI001128ABF6|nr:pyridoxal phosphate-dependent aminotransferase [Brevibacterium sp. XM4083]MCM1011818.1 pyridoxal phosphate-dependent aminotransferase [Brevibacterium sp. XM4083]